jgi:fibrillarin-like pre-rRNA processing protein
MKNTNIEGVYKDCDKLFTENPIQCKGSKVYNEKLINKNGKEFRLWNPYRSKFAAAFLNGLKKINLLPNSTVLYLGAATGTTVSHVSDIIKNGVVYSVENSPIAIKKLFQLTKQRQNIIPILADANHPEKYSSLIPQVDIVYQDISQRNQAEIFYENTSRFLKENGQGILMIKARSIDVSLKPKKAYEHIYSELTDKGLKIIQTIDLAPYEKDHAAVLISL